MAHLARLRHSSCARTFHTSRNRSMRQDRRRGGGWWVGDHAHVTRDFHLFTRTKFIFTRCRCKKSSTMERSGVWAGTNEVHFGHTSQVMPAKPAHKRSGLNRPRNRYFRKPGHFGHFDHFWQNRPFWPFWPPVSEAGWTSRKKVPLRIRLKSPRRSQIRVFAHVNRH